MRVFTSSYAHMSFQTLSDLGVSKDVVAVIEASLQRPSVPDSLDVRSSGLFDEPEVVFRELLRPLNSLIDIPD